MGLNRVAPYCLYRRAWENHVVPYLAALFGGDKGPATQAAHALHQWALHHMGEPPVVSRLLPCAVVRLLFCVLGAACLCRVAPAG
jgi:hypothetical protein